MFISGIPVPKVIVTGLEKRMARQHLFRIIILFCLSAGLYGNTLWNGFAGDDITLLTVNTFYDDAKNIFLIFSPAYTHNLSRVVVDASGENLGSGSVAYRPVLTLSYFLDSFLWKKKSPWGYHLQNVLWHSGNCLLVYALFWALFACRSWAFWSALIFAIHPFQTEPVAAIGFRADLLAGFFSLASFLFWIHFRRRNTRGFFVLSLLSFFLAVFSKEAAAPLLFMFVIYDRFWPRKNFRLLDYAGHAGVLLFYLYIYFFVFRNPLAAWTIPEASGFLNRAAFIITIAAGYVRQAFLPWLVSPVPFVYYPVPGPFLSWGMAADMAVLASWAGLVVLLARKYPASLFLAFWSFLFYLPVSQIIVNPNPVAHRYMYLPFVGVAGMFAYIVVRAVHRRAWDRFFPNRKVVIYVCVLAACLPVTFMNNQAWRSNLFLGLAWVRGYPDYYMGHLALADMYLSIGDRKNGLASLDRAYQRLRHRQTIALYGISHMYWVLGDTARARELLEKFMRFYPQDFRGPFLMGRVCIRENNPLEARTHFIKAVLVAPTGEHYDDLLKCLAMLGDDVQAAAWLEHARARLVPAVVDRLRQRHILYQKDVAAGRKMVFY